MKEIRNIGHSVHDRLLNLAHQKGEPYDLVLVRYALERLLYRLSCSEYPSRFVLKGAFLFTVWQQAELQPTRDLDLLGCGPPDVSTLVSIFTALCELAVPDDGLESVAATVRGEEIREGDIYQGVRIRLGVRLGSAQIPVQVDVGFGDVVTPPAEIVDFPTLLDFPAPRVLAYPMPAVVAEKFEAMVMLGIANSRMKDFYDIWKLAGTETFDGATLCTAMSATFRRRQTPMPKQAPLALTASFADHPAKRTQWRAFLHRDRLGTTKSSLGSVIEVLRDFLLPPALEAARDESFEAIWSPGGPWRSGAAT